MLYEVITSQIDDGIELFIIGINGMIDIVKHQIGFILHQIKRIGFKKRQDNKTDNQKLEQKRKYEKRYQTLKKRASQLGYEIHYIYFLNNSNTNRNNFV